MTSIARAIVNRPRHRINRHKPQFVALTPSPTKPVAGDEIFFCSIFIVTERRNDKKAPLATIAGAAIGSALPGHSSGFFGLPGHRTVSSGSPLCSDWGFWWLV
ncbi:uncharacterized protein LOC111240676 [Vigna radiata var. radiata]|uniref:Uncharacterized protein LOC111240676 n=1 Tax=Vigna radiata var. radiata TaxID=3916 RepID=A0A3Q0EJR5_VIGRR|nr:uncharacterized protein LOC111240676 [Vigna radiata var. radiata]